MSCRYHGAALGAGGAGGKFHLSPVSLLLGAFLVPRGIILEVSVETSFPKGKSHGQLTLHVFISSPKAFKHLINFKRTQSE